MPNKIIAFFALPDVQLLDMAGPMDVFSEANRQFQKNYYQTILISPTSEILQTSCHLKIIPDYSIYDELPNIDTLLVSGSPNMPETHVNQVIIDWLIYMNHQVKRLGSVCTGTFLLAKTNLLTNKQVTTHWSVANQLQQRYPEIFVNSESFCLQDESIYTSAGVTSGIDLALYLVEQDLGREIARKTAMHLVTLFKRQGSQRQFSDKFGVTPHGRTVLNHLEAWVTSHIKENITVLHLAEKIGITPRHLSRIFNKEMGLSPIKWLQEIRLKYATQLLRDNTMSLKKVATECGLKNEQSLRSLFVKNLNMTPTEYKKIYQYKIND
ncbi:AraC family transcriptional regulator [Acinetobacter sp. ANC 4558]|uniref:GlxA family transcriptional regulator n=1 Tax=Acinetobacter sp. ANC 4558 TaxID=1977876 RepID=UPI000A32DE83|nr:helix-turn-helix domain-containing protein [Acinetobacter sp. ANC 4558]OTG88042.1 AraC family transcriptional regulator [Acinetobacter sp. ANC 4558]